MTEKKTRRKRIFNPDIHCGARSRRTGDPCRYRKGYRTDHPESGRCYLHGGRSRGAITLEGKKVVAKNAATHGLYSTVLTGRDLARIKTVRSHTNGDIVQSNFELIHAKLLGVVEGDVRMAGRFQRLYGVAEVMAEQGEFDPEDLLDLKMRLAGADLDAITRISMSAASLANAARSLSDDGNIRIQNKILMDFLGKVLVFASERQIRESAVATTEILKLEAGVPVSQIQSLVDLVKDSVQALEESEETTEEDVVEEIAEVEI